MCDKDIILAKASIKASRATLFLFGKKPEKCYILYMKINEKLLKPYDPKGTEDKIYKQWEDSGLFNPDICVAKGFTKPDAETFSIVLPPPNATGVLHLGHSLETSMQDAMIRFERMQGKKTLWLPGTDHAAIATDAKVTKILEKDGIKKREIGREKFLEHVDAFVTDSRQTIQKQLRKMGASLDWSREAFTLDADRSKAVKDAFVKMYSEGLIERDFRVVNWDPKAQTVISDDEIVHEERKAKLYTFKYSADFPIAISTTRPETKIGDSAVAVNPNDERYAQYIGKTYEVENFCGIKLNIKIVGDESVEKEFGTGALGVTPAHSQIDAEIAMRHQLPSIQVINEFAKMTVGDENILGKKTTEAREAVVKWLSEQNLLIKEEEINQNISTSERTGAVIEPLPKLQWFVRVNKPIPSKNNKTLKDLMLEPVKNKKITVIPERFEKVYYNWVENLRDWCISRQIWYGHRIPVYYKGEEIFVGENPGDGWIQDEDTLDTWFSSGLWSFSTLNKNQDLKTFHPTSVINPGYEILFFWVARMILMSQYLLGEIPFKTVYLHGILRDAKGQKFSKSLGNGIDPIEVINEYGADALRMSLIVGIAPGMDSKFDIQKVKAYGKFANKIWNIGRFVMENCSNPPNQLVGQEIWEEDIKNFDKWGVWKIMEEITEEMEKRNYHIAAEKIYHFIWHTFADEILEEFKTKDEETKKRLSFWFKETFEKSLKLLHPFMPFITEELWAIMGNKEMLMVSSWPTNV